MAQGGSAPTSEPSGSSGQPLDPQLKPVFERRMEADFSAVRLHTDAASAAAADSIGAAAFTYGHDIAFAGQRYAPRTESGQRLLAHELAHVLQQSGRLGPPVKGMVQRQHTGDSPAPVTPAAAPTVPPATTADAPGPAASSGPGGEFVVRAPPPTAPIEDAPLAPDPSVPRVWVRGILVAVDRDFMRGELRRMIAHRGLEGADEWVAMLHGYRPATIDLPFSAHARAHGGLRVRSALDVQREMQQERWYRETVPAALPIVDEVYREVRGEAVAFLVRFESRAKDVVRAILRDSETRIEAERLRYGLTRTESTRVRYRPTGEGPLIQETEIEVRHGMERNLSTQGLAGAAADLTAKRDEVARLVRRREALLTTMPIAGRGPAVRILPEHNRAEHERLGGLIEDTRRSFDILRASLEDRYPILAGFAENPGSVATLANGPSPAAAAVLGEQIEARLANIRTVRDELAPGGRVVVWKLPEIVLLTKGATGATSDTSLGLAHSRVVDDKVRQVEADEAFTNVVLAALAIGLALLAAIPTGGSSLAAGVAAVAAIGSAGVAIGTAATHLQEYQLERAMAGTDFDRARALSAQDPSLFWLAVDILGAMLEVGPALRGSRLLLTSGQRAFTALAPAVRRALTSTGEHAAADLAEVRRLAEAAERGGPDLAARVVANVERLRRSGGRVERIAGSAGHEARAVERAATTLGAEASRGLGRATTRLGSHTVTVTPRGQLVRCTVCGTLREEFAVELAREPDLARRWFEIDEVARRAAATGDRSLAQIAAERASRLADDLEALRRTRDVRLYRGLRAGAIDDVFLMDRRLVVDMPFVGRGAPDTNAAGWLRDATYYWEEMLRRHPEAFSPRNVMQIRGLPPLSRRVSPTNDSQFRSIFPQYDVTGLRGRTLDHHHIGGGGQAAGIPSPLHRGSGNIHTGETAAGITGGENPIAEVLQRLLDQGGGSP